jgi:hypothetical protein
MNNNDDFEIEDSKLCKKVSQDGVTLRVEISRLIGSDDGWSLEVVDHEGGATVWKGSFETDKEAYAEFQRTLDLEGIRSFASRPFGKTTMT